MPSSSTSSSPFSDALSSYQNQTKVDISKHPLLPRLQNCNSPKTILDELRVQAPEFGTRLEDCLTTTVDVLHAFSSTLGKPIGMEYTPSDAILVAIGILLKPVKPSSVSQETLIDLFRRMQTSFQRLKVYTGVPLTERLKGLIVQFMARVLLILAVFPKPVDQRRIPPIKTIFRPPRSKSQTSKGSNSNLTQRPFDSLDKLMDEAELEFDEMRSGGKALEDVKKWLSPPDPSQNYNTLLGAHREGTTAWLFENETYKKWKSGGSLLWISGLRACISTLYRWFVDACLSSGLWKERPLFRDYEEHRRHG
ncbi:hypothetical protein BGW80DRAFT_745617 [Lactifluus volemus]|nr:hypothetical protein BGW80DRAFT_745617 [Lactifluus volemus]